MLSNIGSILILSILSLSLLIIYNSYLDLKNNNQLIKKSIYSLSLFQITFTILSFFTLVVGFIYSDFSIIVTHKNYQFPFHDDTPNKILSGVVYLYPKKNNGTIFSNDKKKSLDNTIVEWKQNRAVFFSRKERETWHTYKGDGINNRVVLVYNLCTKRLKDVYKIEKKNYMWGSLRYKINPYLFRFFRFII